MPLPAAEPVWLTNRAFAYLLEACRRDHRSPLVDAGPAVRDHILAGCRLRYEAGEHDLGRLGGAYFASILAEPSLGPGRPLLAVVTTLVFWALNGSEVDLRPGSLVAHTRRFMGAQDGEARIAALFRERGRRCVRY